MGNDLPRWNAFLRRILSDNEGMEGGNGKTAQKGVQSVRKVAENYRGPCEGGREWKSRSNRKRNTVKSFRCDFHDLR